MGWVTDWSAQAACRTTDPDELFVQGAAQNRAKAVCTGCPVRTECLADALDNRVEFGVWGGMTERERRALLRRRPTVTSWRRLLETARTEYERDAGCCRSTRTRRTRTTPRWAEPARTGAWVRGPPRSSVVRLSVRLCVCASVPSGVAQPRSPVRCRCVSSVPRRPRAGRRSRADP